MHNNQTQLVLELVAVHKDLVCAQGRGGMNPLHYAAQTGNLFLLGRFLAICPKCIEDVTSRNETALHIALKNDTLDAFQLLVGWLRRAWFKNAFFWEKRMLNWWDLDGYSVFHIAASQNKIEVVRWLLDCRGVHVNAKNSEGFTALDIVQGQTQVDNQEMRNMLCRAGAKSTSSRPKSVSFEDYLRSPIPINEKLYIRFIRQRMLISNDMRNILLVVAVLLVTVAYQAVLSPPGGFWQDNYIPSGTNNEFNITAATSASNKVSQHPHRVGTVTMARQFFPLLVAINTLTFYIPLLLIILVLPSGYPSGLLIISFGLLFLSYGTSLSITAPLPSHWLHYFSFFSLFLASNIALVFFVIWKHGRVFVTFLDIEKTDWPTFYVGWY